MFLKEVIEGVTLGYANSKGLEMSDCTKWEADPTEKYVSNFSKFAKLAEQVADLNVQITSLQVQRDDLTDGFTDEDALRFAWLLVYADRRLAKKLKRALARHLRGWA